MNLLANDIEKLVLREGKEITFLSGRSYRPNEEGVIVYAVVSDATREAKAPVLFEDNQADPDDPEVWMRQVSLAIQYANYNLTTKDAA